MISPIAKFALAMVVVIYDDGAPAHPILVAIFVSLGMTADFGPADKLVSRSTAAGTVLTGRRPLEKNLRGASALVEGSHVLDGGYAAPFFRFCHQKGSEF
jgi:hypothetical protein